MSIIAFKKPGSIQSKRSIPNYLCMYGEKTLVIGALDSRLMIAFKNRINKCIG